MESMRLANFAPSVAGFGFSSVGLPVPATPVQLPNGTRIPLDQLDQGLRAGMVLAAADYYAAGQGVPGGGQQPATDSDLYAWLVERTIDFMHPDFVPQVLAWSDPGIPTAAPTGIRSRAQAARQVALPAAIKQVRLGQPGPLLITVTATTDYRALASSSRPVAVYGYDYSPVLGQMTIWVYDPMLPADDSVYLTAYDSPEKALEYSVAGVQVAGAFAVPYVPRPAPVVA